MRICAYCPKVWRVSTWLTLVSTGADFQVLTSPPLDGGSFPYRRLEEVSLFYLRLHGLPGQSYLYGDRRGKIGATAFSGKGLCGLDLSNLVVFMEGCYGAQTKLPEMFLQQGAVAVVASEEKTHNRKFRLGPAGKLGRAFVRALLDGKSVGESLNVKKQMKDVQKFIVFGDSEFRL